jgi:arylsulfatase
VDDKGALTKKRMEAIDDETTDAAVDYMQRQIKAGTPFFCWMNTTRMHFRTHVRAEHRDKPGLTARTEYADGMIEHDNHVGKLLKAVDDLGIADNAIVLYTTDNGSRMNSVQPIRRPRAVADVGQARGRVTALQPIPHDRAL